MIENKSKLSSRESDLLALVAFIDQILIECKYSPEVLVQKILSLIGKELKFNKLFLLINQGDFLHSNQFKLFSYWFNDTDYKFDISEWNQISCSLEAFKKIDEGIEFDIENNFFQDNNINNAIFSEDINQYQCLPVKKGKQLIGFLLLERRYYKYISSMELLTLKLILHNVAIVLQRDFKDITNQNKQITEIQIKDFYESILDSIPSYISVMDENQKYIYLSKSSISDEDVRAWLIGKNDFDYCNLRMKEFSFAERRSKLFDRAIATRSAVSMEEDFTLKNGRIKRELRSLTPVYDCNRFKYMIAYGIDITDIKNKDEIITKQYHALENSPVGIALLDNDGKYYYMNPFHATLFGYQVDELIGESWKKIYEEEEVEKINSEYFPILSQKGFWAGETRGIKKNGEEIYQDIVLATFEDGGLVCITRDITGVKEELNRIQVLHNQLELALTSANLGMWVYHVNDGKIDYHNTFLKLIGYNREEIPELTVEIWFSLMHPDDLENVRSVLQNHIQQSINGSDELFRVECRLRHKNGNYVWLLGVGKSQDILSDSPKLIGFNIDITLIKEAEIELKKSLEKEKQLNELKSRFVSMASHEFRTPLATIRLGVELIQNILFNNETSNISPTIQKKVEKKLGDIVLEVDRITDLMSNILTMGKVDTNKITFNPVITIAKDFLFDFFDTSDINRFKSRKIILEFNLKQHNCLINIDQKLMFHVFDNLMSNAIKYSDNQSIIKVTADSDDHYIVIQLEDQGVGISEEELPFIFESFYRSPRVENITGSGLGMSIVKLFTEMNNGEVILNSTLNKGTIVKVKLPILKES